MKFPREFDPLLALQWLQDPDPEVRKAGANWVSHTAFVHGERRRTSRRTARRCKRH